MGILSLWFALGSAIAANIYLLSLGHKNKKAIFLLNDNLVKNHGYLSGEISNIKRMYDLSRYELYISTPETAGTVKNTEELRWNKLREILDKNEVQELYDEVALLRRKLELLEEVKIHVAKPEKQEPKKRDQKEKAIKLIIEALTYAPHTFSEIAMLLEENDVSLKKSTIGVYLSSDDRFESKEGKWKLKESDESPGVL